METFITINGSKYPFTGGETILDVAGRNDIFIPTLCHLSGTAPTGACRVCLVEVEGARTLMPACSHPAADGMVVHTDSTKVVETRRFVLALLMVSGNHNCAAGSVSADDWTDFQLSVGRYESTELCPAYGTCTLQKLAYQYQVSDIVSRLRLSHLEVRHPVESANPYIVRDFSRCILCGRCIKACNEIQLNRAISFGYRGALSKIVTRGDNPLIHSDCVFCGECVQACPVGALVEKENRYSARPWLTRRIRSTCLQCSVGCGIHVYSDEKAMVKIDGDMHGSVNQGSLCYYGRYAAVTHAKNVHPSHQLLRRNGRMDSSSMDEVLDFTSLRLKEIIQQYGPESVACVMGAGYTNEDYYIAQKFFRTVAGTNNIDTTARLRDIQVAGLFINGHGSRRYIGSIRDLETADSIVLIGSDTTASHPVAAACIKHTVASGRGKLVVVDPQRTVMAGFAALHIQPVPGSDTSWLYGLMRAILSNDAVRTKATGIPGIENVIVTADCCTPGHVHETSGIPVDLLAALHDVILSSRKVIFCFSSGITQHIGGTGTLQLLSTIVHVLNTCAETETTLLPLFGGGNTRGAIDMGCLPELLPGHVSISDPGGKKYWSRIWNGVVPSDRGLTYVDCIPALERGVLKALFCLGTNPYNYLPHQSAVKDLFDQIPLLVVQNETHTHPLDTAHVRLRSYNALELEGSTTGTDGTLRTVKSPLLPDEQCVYLWKFFSDLGRRFGYNDTPVCAEDVFREISAHIPLYGGTGYEHIEREGGILLPVSAPSDTGTPEATFLSDDLSVFTLNKSVVIEGNGDNSDEYRFTLSLSVSTLPPRETTHGEDPDVSSSAVIHPSDAASLGLKRGDSVTVRSRRGSITIPVVINSNIFPGMIRAPLSACITLLPTGGRWLDPEFHVPSYKNIRVCIESLSG